MVRMPYFILFRFLEFFVRVINITPNPINLPKEASIKNLQIRYSASKGIINFTTPDITREFYKSLKPDYCNIAMVRTPLVEPL